MPKHSSDNPTTAKLKLIAERCPGCGAPIVWAEKAIKPVREAASAMLHLTPECYLLFRDANQGNVLKCLASRELSGTIQSIALTNGQTITGDQVLGLFVDHWATCLHRSRSKAAIEPRE